MGFSENGVVFFFGSQFSDTHEHCTPGQWLGNGTAKCGDRAAGQLEMGGFLSHPQVVRMIWDTPPVLSHLDMEMYDVDVKLI